jgi:hypothetical protein
MTPTSLPAVLSDWYELVEGEELMQGDIIEGCPVFRPPPDLALTSLDEAEFSYHKTNMIVMSQSCDLAGDQKADMWLALLCPLWRLDEATRANPFLASTTGKEECRRGHLTGYHMISGCNQEQWTRQISIVSFREVWSLPLTSLRTFAGSLGARPRMRSPYREHLAQAFARYFMRVGLPADIPAFQDEKEIEKLTRKLRAMDEPARRKILSAFG